MVFQYRVGSGEVLEKIPGSGSGRSVKIYERVFSGIFFTLGYFRVFLGISGYFWGKLDIIPFFEVVSQTLRFFSNIAKIHK